MKKFSLKKLLICIMFSVMVTSFIGFTICFIESLGSNVTNTTFKELANNEDFIEDVKSQANVVDEIYNEFQNSVSELKDKYGEDYPAEGMLLQNALMISNSEETIYIYLVSVLLGISIGTVVYIFSEQKANGKVLILELLLSAAILVGLLFAIDGIYYLIINLLIKTSGYNVYIKDTSLTANFKIFILGLFGVFIVIVYLLNLIIQKINSKKLNEALNKK